MGYKRIVVAESGGPEVLELIEEESLPEPGPGEVRLRVHAAGVAFADIMLREGIYKPQPAHPFSPGYDVVGEVDKKGDGVVSVNVGDMAAAIIVHGGYSEYIILNTAKLMPLPKDINPYEAVCLTLNYVAAYQMLYRVARVSKGKAILVHAAGGGVGSALCQLAALGGISVVGTASAEKHEMVRGNGAEPIDYKQDDFVIRAKMLAPQGIEAAFDPISFSNWRRSLKAIKRGGHLVVFGMLNETLREKKSFFRVILGIISFMLLNLFPDGKRKTFFAIDPEGDMDSIQEDYEKLVKLYLEGKIKPAYEKMPLSKAGAAQEKLANGEVKGKLVLDCKNIN